LRIVSEEELKAVMNEMEQLRAWCVRNRINPWAFREALLIALELDTVAALGRGVRTEELEWFDETVRRDVRGWLR